MSIFLSFLGNLRPVHLLIVALVFLLAALGIQTWRIDNLKKAVDHEHAALVTCEANIALQNQAINSLKEVADQQQAAGKAALAVAQAQTQSNQKLVSRILASTPKATDFCSSANDLILEVTSAPGR